MDRSRRCWISSFRFFATSRSDAPVGIDLVLFAAFCRFYLASLVILIVLSLHTFPTRFRLYLPFRFRFLRPALLSLSSFPCSCSLFFFVPFPLSLVLSRFPSPCPVFCSVPPPSRLSRSPVPSPVPSPVSLPFPPWSRFPVRFPVLCFVLSSFGAMRAFVRSCAVCAFVRSVVRSFLCSFVSSFVRSLVRASVRSFVRWDLFPLSPVLPPVLSRPSPISRLPLFY